MAAILDAILDSGRAQVVSLVRVCFKISKYVFYLIPCVSKHIFRHFKCVSVIPNSKVMRKTGNGGHFGRHLGLRKTLKEDS